jgi:hypothetical protein
MQNKLTINGKTYLVLEVEGMSPAHESPPVIMLSSDEGEHRYMSTFSFLDKYWWIYDAPLEKGMKINVDKKEDMIEVTTRKPNENY